MRLRTGLLVVIGLLYILSVPWYRTPGVAPEIWWGLPDWVAVSVGCYVAVAILNAFAWLSTEVPDAPPEAGSGGSTGAQAANAAAGARGEGGS